MINKQKVGTSCVISIIFVTCWLLVGFSINYSNSLTLKGWVQGAALPSIQSITRPYWVTNNNSQTSEILAQLNTNLREQMRLMVESDNELPDWFKSFSIYSIGDRLIGEPEEKSDIKLSATMLIQSESIPVSFSYQPPEILNSQSLISCLGALLPLLLVYYFLWPTPLSKRAYKNMASLRLLGIDESNFSQLTSNDLLENLDMELFKSIYADPAIDAGSAIRLASISDDQLEYFKRLLKLGVTPLEAEQIVSSTECQDLDIEWYQHLRFNHDFDTNKAIACSLNSEIIELHEQDSKVILGGIEGKLKPKQFCVLAVVANRIGKSEKPISLPKEGVRDEDLGKEFADIYERLKGSQMNVLKDFLKGVEKDEIVATISALRGSIKKLINDDNLATRFEITTLKENGETLYSIDRKPDTIKLFL